MIRGGYEEKAPVSFPYPSRCIRGTYIIYADVFSILALFGIVADAKGADTQFFPAGLSK
jgi:hypothetical protein